MTWWDAAGAPASLEDDRLRLHEDDEAAERARAVVARVAGHCPLSLLEELVETVVTAWVLRDGK